MVLTPIVSAILFSLGGMDQAQIIPFNQKLWRWLGIGVFIGITYSIIRHTWIPLLSIPAYIISIQAFPYGEKSWLNPLGELGKFALCGFMFGLASIFVLGIFWGFMQAIISCIAWIGIKKWDDHGVLVNPWTELLRGGLGTIVFLFA